MVKPWGSCLIVDSFPAGEQADAFFVHRNLLNSELVESYWAEKQACMENLYEIQRALLEIQCVHVHEKFCYTSVHKFY